MNQNTFCSFRWVDTLINLESCEVRSCCKTPAQKISLQDIKQSGPNVFENSAYIKQRRAEMLSGIKHSDCSHCWSLEDKNIFHLRKRSSSFKDFVTDYGFAGDELLATGLNKTTADRLTDVHQTENLEVLLKNTCQMKCHYCNADFSSSWEIENRSQGVPKKQKVDAVLQEQFNEQFWKFLPTKLSSLKELNIIGGEPLLQNEFYELLDKIEQVRTGSSQTSRLTINVISNLSISEVLMDRFLKKVASLKKTVNFHLLPSIDSTGERAEYVRSGLKWDLFERNLERAFASQLFNKIRFIVTTSVFSVSDLLRLLQFFYSKAQAHPLQRIELVPNIVTHPAHLSPTILDASFSKYLKNAIEFLSTHQLSETQDQNTFVEFLINLQQTLETQDQSSLQPLRTQWRAWIEKYDLLRQTHFLNTHPEFVTFWSQQASSEREIPPVD